MLKKLISSLVVLIMMLTLSRVFALEQLNIVAEVDPTQPCALKITASGVSTPINGNVFLTRYKDEPMISSIAVKELLITGNGEQTVSFDLPTVGGNYKFLIWDENQHPLTDVIPITIESHNVAEGKEVQPILYTNPVGNVDYLTDGKESETEFWGDVDGGTTASYCFIDLLTPVSISDISVHIPQAAVALYSSDTNSGNIIISLSNNADISTSEDSEGVFFAKPEAGWHSANVDVSGKFRFVKIWSFTGMAIGLSEIKVSTTNNEKESYELTKEEFTKVNQVNGSLSVDKVSNIIDGDVSTSWTATDTYTEVEIDFGEELKLSQLRVLSPNNADTTKRYYIYFLDAAKTDVKYYVTDFNKNSWRTFPITSEIPVRYVKLVSENVGGIAFSEIQIKSFQKSSINNLALSSLTFASLDKAMAPGGGTKFGNPMNLIDGNIETDWGAINAQTIVSIDLGKGYNISDVRTISKSGVPAGHYYIQFLNESGVLIDTVDGYCMNDWKIFSTVHMGSIRYLKIWSNNDDGIGASLAEVKILSTETPTVSYNLAANPSTKIYFNSAFPNSGTAFGKLENLIDGDTTSYWGATSAQTVFDIDLGKDYNINSVRTISQKDVISAHYYIQFWNEAGVLLNTVEDDNRDAWTLFGAPNAPVRYLRVWSNSTSASFSEITVLSTEFPAEVTNVALKAEGAIMAGPSGTGALKNAFDGDLTTAWTADAGSNVEHKITFDKPYNISQIRVISPETSDSSALYYIVFYNSQGEMIQQGNYYVSGNNNAKWQLFSVNINEPVSAIRFTNAASSRISFAEVQIYTSDKEL